ncbi:MAG TPA: hypothetical protein VH394_20345 [Thermoanaerobaculia bacterium]|jgi:uncharacterized repeat protein (TIGR01451 family)|nr:hypothetical protein [Thermoanaerobaculia bacterium]
MKAKMMNSLTVGLMMLIVLCGAAAAQHVPSSDVLLPYFEVDNANQGGVTTLFAVGNATEKPVDVIATVHTNWGIQILEVPFTLQPHEVRTVNLRDWFKNGGNPQKTLAAADQKHLVAAASGQRSPKDNLYYSTEIQPDLLAGYVIIRTQGSRPDALWGDWFNVDVAGNLARGDVLANIDRSTGCPGVCRRHLLRYLSGGGFDGGTEVIIWRETVGKPSANAAAGPKMQADATAFDEPGQAIDNRELSLLPVEKVVVNELGLRKPFGSLDIVSEDDVLIAVQHTAENRYSVGLYTYCLPLISKPGPGIEILKVTNGQDANAAPGPSIPVGATVTWEYLVTNTGDVPLTDVVVEDDDPSIKVTCPKDTLAPGESMTCKASGKAKACQYKNLGGVSALSSKGTVNASDPSHYFGDEGAALAITSILVNDKDATKGPGPDVEPGPALSWKFTVKNTGKVKLTGVQLTGINATCAKSVLEPNESTVCTASSQAAPGAGSHSLPVQAQGKGQAACSQPSADGIGYYKVPDIHECREDDAIEIQTAVNGQDADSPKGPEVTVGSPVSFAYVVKNTGKGVLTAVEVSDSKGLALSCPKDVLQVGESMTCTASGNAQVGQFTSVGTATANAGCVTDDDSVNYYGVTPGLQIIKLTNGQDANAAPGPEIAFGGAVTWTYQVKNTGDVTLSNLSVTDDKGVAVSCPKTTLAAGESMNCTGSGTAQACQYENLGTVTGKTPSGQTLTASDPSHYFGKVSPALDVEVKVNGDDADTPKGPEVQVGSALSFTYIVKNTGDAALSGIQVSDSQGVSVSCPKTSLAAGESMTCTGSGTAQAGQYSATGTASGTGPCNTNASDSDPVHYYGVTPGLKIVKLTNGQDANVAPGPEIPVGSTVTWTYQVTNTGEVALSNLSVSDDKGVAVSCPKTTLAAGESMTCTGSGKAQACQYENLGTVTGKTPSGQTLTASDPSHYYGKTNPAIDVEVKVNGDDADSPKGPEIPVGSPVSFTYIVKNTGDVALSGIKVTDSKGLSVSCPKTSLAVGESMTCTANSTAQAGQYSSVGTASANGACDAKVSDSDPVNYFGTIPDEGCTPGYWKNHTDSWPPTGFSTGQSVQSVFNKASLYPTLANATLLQALSFQGGDDLKGSAEILLRAATAGLLNTAHPGVDYPRTTAQLVSDVNAALASMNRDVIISLAAAIDQDNNLGCPLN